MKRPVPGWRATTIVACALVLLAASASAKSPIKLRGEGEIAVAAAGPSTFVLAGTASHLGRYTGYGEVDIAAGSAGHQVATGVAVLTAANGDQIVGEVTWDLAPGGEGEVQFSWRDEIQLADETFVSNTGRFVEDRPPGVFTFFRYRVPTFGIIAILIG